ncbi:MAG: DUF6057 family protein [Prevotella sp.]|nr:DUF6057 family protein [Prevotella sp.]
MTGLEQKHNTGSSTATRLTCAVCFVVLCWLWIYVFQADTMAVKQHLLSKGHTTYERHVGAVVITMALLCVQQMVYVVASRIMARMSSFDNTNVFFSRYLWTHIIVTLALMLTIIFATGTDAAEHYADRVEMDIVRGQMTEALQHGRHSQETSPRLTMLRAYALARQGQLGDRFFTYATAGTAADLLPGRYSPADTARSALLLLTDSRTTTTIYPTDDIYRSLGAVPKTAMTADRFMQLLCSKDSVRRGNTHAPLPRMARDYQLVMLLMQRRLADFALLLKQSYKLGPTLPRHYREALVMYQHMTATPRVSYRDDATETDYADYQEMRKQYPEPAERHTKRLEQFADTYWYYYDYAPRLQP